MEASTYIRELLQENEPTRLLELTKVLGKDTLVLDKVATMLVVMVATNPCLIHNLEHMDEFASTLIVMLTLGFESGKRAGRSELMEELGMPK